MVDFQGHMSMVVFLSGCNFRCGFCHNAQLMAEKQKGITWSRLEEVCRELADNWVDGVVITGGEPTMSDNLSDLIEFFRRFGWAVKLDTNGSRPGVIGEMLPLVDYVAMDVKAGSSGYPSLTGFTSVGDIVSSIQLVKDNAKDYEFRTTVIESFHTDDQMREIGEMIKGTSKYVIQAFVPRDNLPGLEYRTMQRTNPDRLNEIAGLMRPYAEQVIIRGEG